MTKKDRELVALRALVDELGDLELETQPWRAKLARVEALRAALRAAFANEDPTQMYTTEGERWTCLVGLPGSQSVIDREALLKLIGSRKFAAIATVSLKALETAYGASVLGQVVSTAQTGPRALSIVPRRIEE